MATGRAQPERFVQKQVPLPAWQGAWPRLCIPVPAGAAPGAGPAPLHLDSALSVHWAVPLAVLAPERVATASPARTTLKPLSRNWQFCHIYSQQIGLSGARWGSPEARREIGLKWRVRLLSLLKRPSG